MPISVRLDDHLEQRLARASKRLRLNRSEVIKRSLEYFLDNLEPTSSAFELGADLFGADQRPGTTASETTKASIKKILRAKHHR